MFRLSRRAALAAVLLGAAHALAAAPGSAPKPGEPPGTDADRPSDGAFKAGVLVNLPPRVTVEARLSDDAPAYLPVRDLFVKGLDARGWSKPGGEPCILWITVERRPAVDEARGGREIYLGRLALELVTAATNQRLWQAEAIYRPFDSDIIRGALTLVPHAVASLGKTVPLESVTLY